MKKYKVKKQYLLFKDKKKVNIVGNVYYAEIMVLFDKKQMRIMAFIIHKKGNNFNKEKYLTLGEPDCWQN